MTTKSEMFKKFLVVAAVFVMVIAMVALVACQPAATTPTGTATEEEPATGTPPTAGTPTVAQNENGVWTAEAWKDIYPHEYETYMQNELNDTDGNASDPFFEPRGDMVALYAGDSGTMLETIWNPSMFNKYYNEPNGHNYSLVDIRATERIWDVTTNAYRPTAFSNCYTCKSADYTAILQDQGDAAYQQPFVEQPFGDKGINEPISCWNCHGNNLETDATDASVEVTQPFFIEAMGADAGSVDVGSQTCGQCHNEYYFKPGTRAVTNPYTGLDSMNAEDMYEYYKTAGADGAPFADHTNPLTGVAQIKAQHPEFEFVFGDGGSSMSKRINPNTGDPFGCADCHMGNKVVAEDGIEYTSHLLISPLENKELVESTCQTAGCHVDLQAQVDAWQKESEDKVFAIGAQLEELNKKLADAVTNNTLTEEELATVRELNRESQWYWDFVMVENSEGSHNPTLSNKLLSLSETAVVKALTYFE